ncbi:hypothetical protein PR048_005768 [Dryococelus australis]|uniref:Uncharacterized protein n=1 Tax=Dryococelus australis TaxID=614101 RepID=A0ABQ9IBA0_9NEOP|nr:hypothetical protein PR048_005768 [Dryococelus australis]
MLVGRVLKSAHFTVNSLNIARCLNILSLHKILNGSASIVIVTTLTRATLFYCGCPTLEKYPEAVEVWRVTAVGTAGFLGRQYRPASRVERRLLPLCLAFISASHNATWPDSLAGRGDSCLPGFDNVNPDCGNSAAPSAFKLLPRILSIAARKGRYRRKAEPFSLGWVAMASGPYQPASNIPPHLLSRPTRNISRCRDTWGPLSIDHIRPQLSPETQLGAYHLSMIKTSNQDHSNTYQYANVSSSCRHTTVRRRHYLTHPLCKQQPRHPRATVDCSRRQCVQSGLAVCPDRDTSSCKAQRVAARRFQLTAAGPRRGGGGKTQTRDGTTSKATVGDNRPPRTGNKREEKNVPFDCNKGWSIGGEQGQGKRVCQWLMTRFYTIPTYNHPSESAGNRTRFALVGGEYSDTTEARTSGAQHWSHDSTLALASSAANVFSCVAMVACIQMLSKDFSVCCAEHPDFPTSAASLRVSTVAVPGTPLSWPFLRGRPLEGVSMTSGWRPAPATNLALAYIGALFDVSPYYLLSTVCRDPWCSDSPLNVACMNSARSGTRVLPTTCYTARNCTPGDELVAKWLWRQGNVAVIGRASLGTCPANGSLVCVVSVTEQATERTRILQSLMSLAATVACSRLIEHFLHHAISSYVSIYIRDSAERTRILQSLMSLAATIACSSLIEHFLHHSISSYVSIYIRDSAERTRILQSFMSLAATVACSRLIEHFLHHAISSYVSIYIRDSAERTRILQSLMSLAATVACSRFHTGSRTWPITSQFQSVGRFPRLLREPVDEESEKDASILIIHPMEQRRNAKAGETEDPRENSPDSGFVRRDSHLRKSVL